MNEEIQLLPPHPHAGERGYLTDEVILTVTNTPMILIKLINCEHGTDACYAQKHHIGRVTITPLVPRKKRRR